MSRKLYPWPLDRLPHSIASTLTGGGGVSIPLAAKYQGGKELHDATGHLPRDADGYYLSRTTGERLVIDDGYAETDTVGPPKPHGALSVSVVGAPATLRRSGFDALSDSAYLSLSMTGGAASIATRATLGAAAGISAAFDSSVVNDRLALLADGSGNAALVTRRTGDPGPTTATSGVTWAGNERIVTGAVDGTGTMTCRAFSPTTGALLGGGTAALGGAPTHSGTHYTGRLFTTGYAWNPGSIAEVYLWDGSALSTAQQDAVAADIAAGEGCDYIRSTYSPTVATDGLVCGVYDADNPTELFTGSGTGADVVVERPA